MTFSRHTASRLASVVFALLLAILLVPVAAATSAAAAEADTIHGLVNQARWDDGQRGLIRNAEMDAVALAWAKQMAANDTMSHNPNYSSQIPSGWNSAGENVAHWYRTAQAMHDGWMSSKGHRENILGAFTDIGIAFYSSGGTTWGVQVFAAYPGHTGPARAAAPAPAEKVAPSPAATPTTAPTSTPTPIATEREAGGADVDATPSPLVSAGATGAVDSDVPPALSQAELQASVYGNEPDVTWIAWTIFFGVIAVAGALWFLLWRRAKSRGPAARRARK